MPVTVRRADLFDVEALVPLFDAYRQFYRLPADLEQAHRFLTERLERHESVVYLAFTGSGPDPAGFTQLYPAFSSLSMRRAWVLNDLYVVPGARRAGVARALLEEARRHALDSGAVYLELETEVINTPAQQLYESLGWRRSTGFYRYELGVVP
ncbi:MAG: GNAT family N-acetyltransferase [Gemmatimonadota bacterium]